jgi:hypothetical protein
MLLTFTFVFWKIIDFLLVGFISRGVNLCFGLDFMMISVRITWIIDFICFILIVIAFSIIIVRFGFRLVVFIFLIFTIFIFFVGVR